MPERTASNDSVEEGAALCLSGGGYRAMVFHAGALWRLYEADLLGSLSRISSVSGGSIAAAVLGLAWRDLSFEANMVSRDFVPLVVEPIRRMARTSIDVRSVSRGVLFPGSVSNRIAKHYREVLFGDATLQDLPAGRPRFVINATNVQSGALWRFMRPYMRDWRVGEVRRPEISLATAVAASSAFPPVLSPMILKLDPASFRPGSGKGLQREPFTSRVVLCDGGVYDNLGLETAYKRYRCILVSDAGGQLEAVASPRLGWARQSYRVLNIIDNQVRSLRKRELIGAYEREERTGAYWGVRTQIERYDVTDSLPCPPERVAELADIPTRLTRMEVHIQERLINWGYAVCDAAIRAHVDGGIPKGRFPYPDAGV